MNKPPAKKKTPGTKATGKPTSKQMAGYISSKRDAIAEAVHGTLNLGEMPAVSLHSVRLAVAHHDLDDSPCPQCAENEQCVFDTASGEFVCAPK